MEASVLPLLLLPRGKAGLRRIAMRRNSVTLLRLPSSGADMIFLLLAEHEAHVADNDLAMPSPKSRMPRSRWSGVAASSTGIFLF